MISSLESSNVFCVELKIGVGLQRPAHDCAKADAVAVLNTMHARSAGLTKAENLTKASFIRAKNVQRFSWAASFPYIL